jgi:hypothetical protein
MSIAPGHTGWATVTVAKGAPDQDVAALFAASAGQGAGTARVSGPVGNQVAVGHVPGCHIPAPAAAPAHPGGGIGAEVGLALIARWPASSRQAAGCPGTCGGCSTEPAGTK